MAVRTSTTAHIDAGLDAMRRLRAARAGITEAARVAQELPTHDGFCLKCQAKVTAYTERVRASGVSGVMRHHGPCPNCGSQVSTFVKKEAKAPA